MAATVIREQLMKHLPETLEDDKLLSECISICQNYNISGTDLFYKWEAKLYSSGNPSGASAKQIFTLAAADDIKKALVEELNKKRLKEQSTSHKRVDVMGMMRRGQQNGARSTKVNIGSVSAQTVAKSAVPRVSFKDFSDGRTQKYRYMYEKISERSEVLDERIDEFGELVREHYNIDDLGDPFSISEEDVVVVGRVCTDMENGVRLSEDAIFLESSRMMGSGGRVPLRFSSDLKLRGTVKGIGAVSFFPGAIVALKGKNGGGGWFVVREVLGIPPLRPRIDPEIHTSFTMAVACGPYTSDSDLEYKHLTSLMDKLRSSRPSVILLLGPFVDYTHSLIKSGEVKCAPSDLFIERFAECVQNLLDSLQDSLIILEPSIKDLLSDHPVFPQCGLSSFIADSRIKMVANPGRFSINNVTFATTSVDVLFHLRSQEFMQRGEEVQSIASSESATHDVLAGTCRHLLLQRSFYPLFPVPADLSSEVNLDVSHLEGLRLNMDTQEYAPDVMVLPSRLKHFCKTVESTLIINPSFLTKGSFAMLTMPDCTRIDLQKSISCEIVKL